MDYTIPAEMARLDIDAYDNVLLLGSDRLDSGEESDARTIVGYLMMQKALASKPRRPHIIIEILDPTNVGLLGKRRGEVLVSPVILSHMLAQVALRQELNAVFSDIFASGGTEITFRSPQECRCTDVEMTFESLREKASSYGELALGILRNDPAGEVNLNLNPPRSLTFTLSSDDEVVVLSSSKENKR